MAAHDLSVKTNWPMCVPHLNSKACTAAGTVRQPGFAPFLIIACRAADSLQQLSQEAAKRSKSKPDIWLSP
jgi:hypothetical protein